MQRRSEDQGKRMERKRRKTTREAREERERRKKRKENKVKQKSQILVRSRRSKRRKREKRLLLLPSLFSLLLDNLAERRRLDAQVITTEIEAGKGRAGAASTQSKTRVASHIPRITRGSEDTDRLRLYYC